MLLLDLCSVFLGKEHVGRQASFGSIGILFATLLLIRRSGCCSLGGNFGFTGLDFLGHSYITNEVGGKKFSVEKFFYLCVYRVKWSKSRVEREKRRG